VCKMRNHLVIIFIGFVFFLKAQTKHNIHLDFSMLYGADTLNLKEGVFKTNDANDLQFLAVKFYISNVQFLKNEKVVFQATNSFHLIDASKLKTLGITMPNNAPVNFDAIQFNLGIDSLINVSGAMEGDLDLAKGMYWTWQSGYINFKLEGTSNLCNTRNHEFQFHIGGYQMPFYSMQTITLPIKHADKLLILLDLKKMMDGIDLKNQNHIMSPNSEALLFSKRIAQAFSVHSK
jgi:hypothetical protein